MPFSGRDSNVAKCWGKWGRKTAFFVVLRIPHYYAIRNLPAGILRRGDEWPKPSFGRGPLDPRLQTAELPVYYEVLMHMARTNW
jgi:hypothetical protein